MSPTVAAPPPPEHNASTRPRPLQGRGLSASQRPPQRAGSSPCVPAVPGPSATSRVGGRRKRCRPSLFALPNLIASAMSLTRPRHGLSRRRRQRPVTAAHDRLSSGMPRAANERASRSWASPAAGPQPARSSPRHGDGQAACADARPGRHLSPSSRSRPWRLCRPKHASLRAVQQTPGRSAVYQSALAPEERLVAMRAGGAGSVGSISGRGKRTAAPMSAGYGCGSDCGGAVGDHAPS